jgi:hypothetical protein
MAQRASCIEWLRVRARVGWVNVVDAMQGQLVVADPIGEQGPPVVSGGVGLAILARDALVEAAYKHRDDAPYIVALVLIVPSLDACCRIRSFALHPLPFHVLDPRPPRHLTHITDTAPVSPAFIPPAGFFCPVARMTAQRHQSSAALSMNC